MPRRDRGLDGRGVEREVVLEAGCDVDRRPAREQDRRHVGNVRGLVQDDLVARVDRGPHRKIQGLRRADRDQQLGPRVVRHAVQALEVRGERAAQLDRPGVRGVVRAALAQRLDAGFDDRPRRVEVRLADPEADDVGHRRRDVEELPDARRRNGQDALRQRPLGERHAGTRGDHRGNSTPATASETGRRGPPLGAGPPERRRGPGAPCR